MQFRDPNTEDEQKVGNFAVSYHLRMALFDTQKLEFFIIKRCSVFEIALNIL